MMIPPLELLGLEPLPIARKPRPAPVRRRTGRMIFAKRAPRPRNPSYDAVSTPPPAKAARIEAARRKVVEKARRSAARSKAAREAAA